jgi:hypothetical protein
MNQNSTSMEFFLSLLRALRVLRGKMRNAENNLLKLPFFSFYGMFYYQKL